MENTRSGRADLVALAAIAATLAVAYAPIALRLIHQWHDDETYSHGFIVVPLALFLGWQRRQAVLTAPRRPTIWGLAVVVASLCVLVVGTLGAELFLARMSFIGVVGGTLLFLFGPAVVVALKVPLLFLLLAIPLPTLVLNAVTFPLQLVASGAGEALIRAAGVPVIREGNVIELASLRLEVVEACSGIRSMMALLTCACVVVSIRPTPPGVAFAVMAATVPVAIATNALRVAIAGLAAQFAGPWAAEGFLHACSGAVLFIIGLSGLLALERSISRFQRSRAAA